MFYIQGEVMSDKFDHLLEIQKKPKKKTGMFTQAALPQRTEPKCLFFCSEIQKYKNRKMEKYRDVHTGGPPPEDCTQSSSHHRPPVVEQPNPSPSFQNLIITILIIKYHQPGRSILLRSFPNRHLNEPATLKSIDQ